MLFLIAYDIANPKRLSRVARRLEKVAVRCQKSVFLFQGETGTVESLLDELATILQLTEDVIQAWRLSEGQQPLGLIRGAPMKVCPSGAVLAPGQRFFLESTDD